MAAQHPTAPLAPGTEDYQENGGAQAGAQQIAQPQPGQQLPQLAHQILPWARQHPSGQGRDQEQQQQQEAHQGRGWQRLAPGPAPAAIAVLQPAGQQQGHRQQRHQHRPHQLQHQQDQQLQAEAAGLSQRSAAEFHHTKTEHQARQQQRSTATLALAFDEPQHGQECPPWCVSAGGRRGLLKRRFSLQGRAGPCSDWIPSADAGWWDGAFRALRQVRAVGLGAEPGAAAGRGAVLVTGETASREGVDHGSVLIAGEA